MDITKSTVWGAVALVVLAVAIFSFRGHLVSQRNACGERLTQLVPALEAYARTHQRALPATLDALAAVAGPLPVSATGQSCVLSPDAAALRWQQTPPVPYLWDAVAHPYVNGFHVLATDGKVYLVDALSDPLPAR